MAERHRQHGKRMADTERAADVRCGECGALSTLVTGADVYPTRLDLASKSFWRCPECGAYVGCHNGTFRPKGSPCGPETRAARIRAHAAFDPLWRRKMVRDGVPAHKARGAAYRWLSKALNMPPEQTHIGMFDAETAERVVELCAPYRRAAS